MEPEGTRNEQNRKTRINMARTIAIKTTAVHHTNSFQNFFQIILIMLQM
jgi:hypothetical protein